MALTPGLGVGDIVKACQFIYVTCRRYKDAHSEFKEIEAKSKSTVVILERLEAEALTGGNLVERAGPQAYEQLNDNLESLRQDVKTLQEMLFKYQKIERDGPGRRMLWALRVSGSLTDLRRSISFHEQALQLWYMTLVYGSLRRLEGGQDEIIEALKNLPFDKLDDIKREIRQGSLRKLERELRKSGVATDTIEANLDVAASYVAAPPEDKAKMESVARSRIATARASRVSGAAVPQSFPFPMYGDVPRPGRNENGRGGYMPEVPIRIDPADAKKLGRSNSTNTRRRTHRSSSNNDARPAILVYDNDERNDAHGRSSRKQEAREVNTDFVIRRSPTNAHQHASPPSPSTPKPTGARLEREDVYHSSRGHSSEVKKYEQYRPRPTEEGAQTRQRRQSETTRYRTSPSRSPVRTGRDQAGREHIILRERRPSEPPLHHIPHSPMLSVPPSPLLSVAPSTGGSSGSSVSHRGQVPAAAAHDTTHMPSHRRTRSADLRPRYEDERERRNPSAGSGGRRYHSNNNNHDDDDDDDDDNVEVIVIESDSARARSRRRESHVDAGDQAAGSARRAESTHSYTRTRRRSSSRGSEGDRRPDRGVRIVQKLDRIDSVPIPDNN